MALNSEESGAAGTASVSGSEPRLQISLPGEFSLRYGERPISLGTPSYQSLLAFLIINAGQDHSRQKLAFQFWPDSGESQTRTNMTKSGRWHTNR